MRNKIVLLLSEHPIWQGSDKQGKTALNCAIESSTVKQEFPLMATACY